MENANLCFSPYEKPWRTASHKCTRFNIINIIWLPLCLSRAWLLSPGGCRRRWRTAFTESAWEGDLGGQRGGSGRPVCPPPLPSAAPGAWRAGATGHGRCPGFCSPKARSKRQGGSLGRGAPLSAGPAPSDHLGAPPSGQRGTPPRAAPGAATMNRAGKMQLEHASSWTPNWNECLCQ